MKVTKTGLCEIVSIRVHHNCLLQGEILLRELVKSINSRRNPHISLSLSLYTDSHILFPSFPSPIHPHPPRCLLILC